MQEMLSALSAHRTKSAGRFCTRVQKVYFNETAECTQWTVKRNALCRLDDFIPFSGSSRLLIPWRSLGLDEILFFLHLVASIPLRPGHQITYSEQIAPVLEEILCLRRSAINLAKDVISNELLETASGLCCFSGYAEISIDYLNQGIVPSESFESVF